MAYVITCGDEGVQINQGTRLAIVGAGVKFEETSKIIDSLKKTFPQEKLRVASSGENDWIKRRFNLDTFEQADATMQQYVEALADQKDLLYSGFLPFADPKMLKYDIKGHMVRPRGIHVANKICLTIAGGEQVYNLGCYLISADWVHLADKKTIKAALQKQIDFYRSLAGRDLPLVLEEEGELDEKVVAANKKIVTQLYGDLQNK